MKSGVEQAAAKGRNRGVLSWNNWTVFNRCVVQNIFGV